MPGPVCCVHKRYYGDFSSLVHRVATNERIPVSGMFELTMKCNLRCGHCYCAEDKSKRELNTGEVLKIIDEITEAGCLWLAFTGGEILLRKDFLDIYIYAKSKGLLVSLLTNGTLLNSRVGRYLKKYKPMQVEITLYGISEEVNEKVTGIRGMLKRTLAAVHFLKENKIPFNLKTTVTKDNISEIRQIKKFAANLNIDYRFDAQLHARIDGAKAPWQYRVSSKEAVELDMKDTGRLREWKMFCDRFWGPIKYDSYFYCATLINSFHIDAYGRLLACILCRSHSKDILKSSFGVCWDALYKKVYAIKPDAALSCMNCELAYLCDYCVGWAEVENGCWDRKSDFLCGLTDLRYKYFLEKGIIDFSKRRGLHEKEISASAYR